MGQMAQQVDPNPDLTDSTEFTVTLTDETGNVSAESVGTVDTTPPSAPVVTPITSNNTSPMISGTAEAGSTIDVVVGGATYQVTADPTTGAWSVDTASATPSSGSFTALTNGTHEVAVTSTDAAGNSSTDTSSGEIFIDTIAPSAPVVSPISTNNTSPAVSGTAEAGSTIDIVIGGATYQVMADENTGAWSVDTASATPISGSFTPLTNGTRFRVRRR